MPPAEVEAICTSVAAETGAGLPKESSKRTSVCELHAPAVTVCAALVNASRACAAAEMVWVWVAAVRPAAVAVNTGEPDFVSLK